jgi:hypothetical protein
MTLDEIAAELPDILHDAVLQTLTIDDISRQATFGLPICVGDPPASAGLPFIVQTTAGSHNSVY